MLQALVERGELPPVEERLPLEPKVVDMFDVGEYGGTWRGGHSNATIWHNDFAGIAGKPSLLSFRMEDAEVQPNIARGWEYVDDGKALVLYLREGLKWSDGHPYTADDLMWWYEDVLQEPNITPAISGWWLIDGELFGLEKIDDYTVKFTFGESVAPSFHTLLALRGEEPQRAPKHYFQQFHPRYADPDELQALLDARGMEEWWQLFIDEYEPTWYQRNDRRPGVPSMYTYIAVRQQPGVVFLERNPYYWKVDGAGNQLPYIDRARVEHAGDAGVLEAMAVAGQLDYYRGFVPQLSLYMRSITDAGNQVAMWQDPQGSRILAYLNRSHKDPVLRELFNNPRFVQALSIAIDREELNNLVWLGLGEVRQFSLLGPSPYWRSEFETAHAQYDLEEARRILREEVGLNLDSNGNLLRPDGGVLRMNLEVVPHQADWLQATELITDYWRALGIDARLQARSEELHMEMFLANEVDVRMWSNRTPPPSVFYNLDTLFIPHLSYAARGWDLWFSSGGTAGVEPTAVAKRVAELRNVFLFDPDPDAREAAINEIFAAQAEHLWAIGAVGNVPQPIVVSGDLANVPEGIWYAFDFAWVGMGRPEAWYFTTETRRQDGGHW